MEQMYFLNTVIQILWSKWESKHNHLDSRIQNPLRIQVGS